MTRLPAAIAGRLGRADDGQVPLRTRHWSLRRLASAGLAAGALAASLHALTPDPPDGRPVVLAAHDLAAGQVLTSADLTLGSRPADQAPEGTLATDGLLGRVLASGVRTGEVLTDARIVGPGLTVGLPSSTVAMPIRIADGGAAALTGPGDHLDVLAASEAGEATTVVRGAVVLARPSGGGDGGLLGGSTGTDSGLLVLAVPGDQAGPLAAAAAHGPLSVALRAG